MRIATGIEDRAGEKESSAGLVRTIGRWSLTGLMVNSIIGGGIFGLPSVLAGELAGFSPLAFIVAGVCILIIAGCVAEVSSRYDETGGLYLYARDAFGRFAGLLVGWLMWLTRIAAPAAVADLFCSYAAQFWPALGTRTGQVGVLIALIGQLTLFNYIGVKTGKNLSNLFTSAKVSFLLLFIGAGLLALVWRPEIRVPLSWPRVSVKTWLEALILLVYAYGGFEGALFVGGETKDPKRNTPVALLVALALVCVFYAAVQYVTIATLPDARASVRPLSDAAQRFAGSPGATAIALTALVSAYGYLSANLLHSPRILFALGEHGDLPSFLAAIHPRYRTPYVSILVYAVLVFAFAAMGNFRWNATLSAVSRLVVYAAMAVAVPVLRHRRDGRTGFLLPVPYLFAGFGALFSLVLLTRMGRWEFVIVAATCTIAGLNWAVIRGRVDNRST